MSEPATAVARAVHCEEHVMGTVVTVDVHTPGGAVAPQLHVALARVRALLQGYDALFSLWKPQSPMSRLRRGEIDRDSAPGEIGAVLDACAAARQLSAGWFDPWAMPGGLDPTGLVKGWAAARALDLLTAAGHPDAMVNAGGDIAVSGSPDGAGPWRLGVQHPDRAGALLAVVELDGVLRAAIATSGTYERGAHLVDPRTGRRRARLASASVVGPDLAQADALATALAVAGPEGLAFVDAADGYEALALTVDGTVLATAGLARASR
jgi:thiamine biosynthesis lipoprotein